MLLCSIKYILFDGSAASSTMSAERIRWLHKQPQTHVPALMHTSMPSMHREELMRRLCAHFASVNRVDDALLSDSDAVAAWVQEVFSRAYALQVVARWVNRGGVHAGEDHDSQSTISRWCPGQVRTEVGDIPPYIHIHIGETDRWMHPQGHMPLGMGKRGSFCGPQGSLLEGRRHFLRRPYFCAWR